MSRRSDAARAAVEARLGHAFANKALLEQALTHVSAVADVAARARSNQRLEFLGDRVLGLAVADMLLAAFPEEQEGELSKRFALLVRAETLAEVAQDLDLGPALALGAGERNSGGRRKQAILADACEALIGAVFLDAGFEAAAAIVARHWRARLAASARPPIDAKTALQEWARAREAPIPAYEVIGRLGPDHAPKFRVTAVVAGFAAASGEGGSKRAAEQAAAQAFLEREGIWDRTGTGAGRND